MTEDFLIKFSGKPMWKIILILAWPIVTEQLLQTAVNYIDTAMVGRIGIDASAAVGTTVAVTWMFNGLMNALGVGYSVLMAHQLGAGHREKARDIVRQGQLAALVGGALLCVVTVCIIAPYLPIWLGVERDIALLSTDYMRITGAASIFNMILIMNSNILRCIGDTKTPMLFNLMMNALNVVGNYFLIYPSKELFIAGHRFVLHRANLGVQGAAAATALSIVSAGTGLALFFIKENRDIFTQARKGAWRDGEIMRRALCMGFPVAMERVMISTGNIIMTGIVAGLGKLSTAANQFACAAESVCVLPAYGFSLAGMTLIAQFLSAGEKEKAFCAGRLCIRICTATTLSASVGMFLLAGPLIQLFTPDAGAAALGAHMLRIEAFAEPFLGIAIATGGLLRGAQDTKKPFYISLIGTWLVRLPSAFVLVRICSPRLSGIWIAMLIDWTVRAAISMWQFYRAFRVC